MRVIAIEEHFTTPGIAHALDTLPKDQRDDSVSLNSRGDNAARLQDIGAARVEMMDAQGIDVQILSVAPPATQALPASAAIRLSREANDLAAQAVAAHPMRFRALATLPTEAA